MAQKRMFSLKIIDTDNFLNMPITARLLYYDLSMRADDDGFIDSPKKILKIIGCAEDDFKILCAKQYIIPFETGICVIKHWHIHNLIRHDRYIETEYKNEKEQLEKIDNKYVLKNVIPNGNQMSYQMAPQVRLGKVSIDKDSIDNSDKSFPLKTDIKNYHDTANKQSIDINKVKEKEKKSSAKRKEKKPAEIRHKYGEHQNVLLTDTEYKHLISDYTEFVVKKYIEDVSWGIVSKGYKYSNFNLTIRNWLRKNGIQKLKPLTDDLILDILWYYGIKKIDNEIVQKIKEKYRTVSEIKENISKIKGVYHV